MKLVSGLIVCISIFALVIVFEHDKSLRGSQSLLGTWEGTDEQGRINVLLLISPSDLVLQQGENGKSTRHPYTLSEGARHKEMKIDGFEERFIVYFDDEETMRLELTEADARQVAVPEISMLTFHRRR
jgi:hypothetical protein